MLSSIWRIVRDREDAQDALQEALAIVWQRLDRIRAHPNPHALILKICADAAYDALRRKLRLRRNETAAPAEENLRDSSPLVSEVLDGRDRIAEVFGAIAELPRNQARAILMRCIQEQSYESIAQALACGEATARKHVERARARLAERLSHFPARRAKERTP